MDRYHNKQILYSAANVKSNRRSSWHIHTCHTPLLELSKDAYKRKQMLIESVGGNKSRIEGS